MRPGSLAGRSVGISLPASVLHQGRKVKGKQTKEEEQEEKQEQECEGKREKTTRYRGKITTLKLLVKMKLTEEEAMDTLVSRTRASPHFFFTIDQKYKR